MIPGLSQQFNRRSAVLVTAPTVEPVSKDELKAVLKIDGTDEDGLLTSLIASARRACEEYTRRSFVTQTWALTQDRFSSYAETISDGYMVAPTPHLVAGVASVHLPRGPVQSISAVETTGAAGTAFTVPTSVYALDTVNGDVVLNSGQAWPTDLREYGAVKFTYVTGYGDAAAVPADLQMAVKMQAASMYDGCGDMSAVVMALLDPYRLPEAFGVW